MPAKSLSRLATEACIANVRRIDDVGDAPYHVVRPILLKVDNPQHLRDIEKNSPQICGADADIWRAFIKRDIRNWQSRQMEPKNPQNWHKVYRKLQKEDEDKIREAQDKLKADMESRKAEKQGNQMQFLDKVINPVRKNLPKQRTTADRTGTAAALRFGSGSRTSAATGQSTINKVKREAREASLYGPRKSALSTPTHLLNMNLTHGRIIGPKTINPPPTPAPTPAASRTMGVIAATNSIARVPMHSTSTAARVASEPRPSPLKRAATSVFMPPKRRRV